MVVGLRGHILRCSILVAVLVFPGASADYLMAGYDAAGTGNTSDAPPEWPDEAFRVQLPGAIGPYGPPLIIGDDVYVTTHNATWLDENLTTDGVWRVNLTTGQAEPLISFRIYTPDTRSDLLDTDKSQRRISIASDGQKLFLVYNSGIFAYSLDGQQQYWNHTFNPYATYGEDYEGYCAPPAVAGASLYVACSMNQRVRTDPLDTETVDVQQRLSLFAFDTEKGFAWRWNAPDMTGRTEGPNPFSSGGHALMPRSVNVVGDLILVCACEDKGAPSTAKLWAVSRSSQQVSWAAERLEPDWVQEWVLPTLTDAVVTNEGRWQGGPMVTPPAAGGSVVVWRSFDLSRITDGQEERDRVEPTDLPQDLGAGPALSGGKFYFATASTLHVFDVATRQRSTGFTLQDHRENWGMGRFIVAGGTLFARADEWSLSHDQPGPPPTPDRLLNTTLYAFDIDVLDRPRWSYSLAPPPGMDIGGYTDPLGLESFYQFSVANGVAVMGGIDGQLVVLGKTAAAPAITAMPSTWTPAAGEPVTVAISEDRGGIHGNITEYAVQWDTSTPESPSWQRDSGGFKHVYAANGTMTARFLARNAAGQATSTTLTFEVGGTPAADERDEALPSSASPELSPLQALFAPENRLLVGTGASLLVVLLLLPMILLLRRKPAAGPSRYEVLREIGRGAHGRTFLALDRQLDRKVVLKQSTAPWLLERESGGRFLREARLLARLDHPNVVRVHEILVNEKPPTLVLEHLAGGTLADRLAQPGALDVAHKSRIARDAVAGLKSIHDAGMVHRDIKPANMVFAADGTLKITDFGVARPPKDAVATTVAETSAGSPLYMSPEQAQGLPADARSDVYAMGATLFEVFAGHHYLGDKPEPEFRIRHRIASGPLPRMPSQVPRPLARWLARSLSKDASARFHSGTEMLAALEQALAR